MSRIPPSPPPEFFVDRSLGLRIVPAALRDLGFTVHTMAKVYPDDGMAVDDVQWITDVDSAGWVALTKDERIVRRPAELAALQRTSLRVFALGNQNLPGLVQAEYFVTNIHRIVQRARKPGPFVDVVHRNGVDRRWPRG